MVCPLSLCTVRNFLVEKLLAAMYLYKVWGGGERAAAYQAAASWFLDVQRLATSGYLG
jgi:hypothetical protein